MHLRILLISLTLLACALPLAAQQKKKPVETPKPAVRPKPVYVKEPEAYGYLLMDTDLDVSISVNYGKTYRVLSKEEGERIPLEAGANLLKITPLDGGQDGYKDTIIMDKKGNQVYSVKLKAQRNALVARKAEEDRKAEEARRAEIKRKEEAERRAEEARQAEIKRKEEEKRRAEEARLAEQKRQEEEAKRLDEALVQINAGMILLPGGTFKMGCTKEQSGCDVDEKPAHSVTLKSFYIGATEVTQAQWRGVMGSNPSHFSGCDNCPVEKVSWDDIQDFLSRLNRHSGGMYYRLPSEAEWEYAARGGSLSKGFQYSGNSSPEEIAWYYNNSGDRSLVGDWDNNQIKPNNCKTHPVKSKKPNELGLYDMSGNVWEWCMDVYGKYSSGSQTNPTGPTPGLSRVTRGGSWYDAPGFCRVANRHNDTSDKRGSSIGFRLARNP